jgi:hypothetical protein
VFFYDLVLKLIPIFTASKELMKKKYLYTISFLFCLFSLTVMAQDKQQSTSIDGLSFYPNPVNTGKIYITSKSSLDKDITIFDVLGKKVLQATINAKELSIASLSPGVYIIKIREGEATATRKLIVK